MLSGEEARAAFNSTEHQINSMVERAQQIDRQIADHLAAIERDEQKRKNLIGAIALAAVVVAIILFVLIGSDGRLGEVDTAAQPQ